MLNGLCMYVVWCQQYWFASGLCVVIVIGIRPLLHMHTIGDAMYCIILQLFI